MPRTRPASARALTLAWALLALLPTGCVAPRLVDERRQEPYARLLETYAGLPRSAEHVVVEVPGERPVGMALTWIRGARGADGALLVLQPGLLAEGSTWRFLVGALGAEHDVLLVDPPGTGGSGAPDPHTAGPHAYSPTWLAACTLGAVEAFEARHGARSGVVLLGHSLGGAVALRALADPVLQARHAALLARVRGALLFNPADGALTTRSPRLLDLAQVSDLEVGVGEWLGLLMKEVRTGVRTNTVHPERDALRSEALRIEALMGRPATRHAAQAMLKRFQPLLADGFHVDERAVARLAEQEATITVPVRILWGTADTTFTREQGAALCRRLPTCRLVALEGVGHSSHQEGVLRTAPEVQRFLGELGVGSATP